MILQELCKYYDTRLADDKYELPEHGYSVGKAAFLITLRKDGTTESVVPLGEKKGNRLGTISLKVPEQQKRAVNIAANFMCDNSSYALGQDEKGKPERSIKTFDAFLSLHKEVLNTDDDGAKSLLMFLERIKCEGIDDKIIERIDDIKQGGNIIFRLSGDMQYLHERTTIKERWMNYYSNKEKGEQGQCLLTGEVAFLSRLHPSIKGVAGAQSSGASLVSFNQDSFTSYGKEQSYNSPVSEKMAFKYGTALNYLLQSHRRVRFGDTTLVYWADQPAELEEESVLAFFNPPFERENDVEKKEDNGQYKVDPQVERKIGDYLEGVKNGEYRNVEEFGLDGNRKFYLLGLAPNNSRLQVRVWHESSFESIATQFAQHYKDMAIVINSQQQNPYPPLWKILRETAVQGKSENINPRLAGYMVKAMLTGNQYPQMLFQSIMMRIRAERNINYVRAGVIKACLLRKARRASYTISEEALTVSLNQESKDDAYLSGRLFSILEYTQEKALPGLNATIKDRFFGAASSNPAIVFPQLLKTAQHHLNKIESAESRNTKIWLEKQIAEVMNGFPESSGFPKLLSLDRQGIFMLGYYHQRQQFYTKKQKEEGVE